jgi:hypothetical protein
MVKVSVSEPELVVQRSSILVLLLQTAFQKQSGGIVSVTKCGPVSAPFGSFLTVQMSRNYLFPTKDLHR